MSGAFPPQPNPTHLERKVEELKQKLSGEDPLKLARRTGAEFQPDEEGGGCFRLPFWNSTIRVGFPAFTACDEASGKEFGEDVQMLLLYYFATSDGSPRVGSWISFSELPDGRFYTRAFQGYTGNALVRAFQSSEAGFMRAAEYIGGRRLVFGDISYAFDALPNVALMAVFWRGDEDFPASIQILFDAGVSHHLSTDVCAVLGSMLTRRLVRALKDTDTLTKPPI